MIPSTEALVSPLDPAIRESSPDELASARALLDLALQPLDRWDGFLHLEQLGSSALRYQLNVIGYALAMSQHTRTPAFTGYLAEAQRNAIDKMRDPKVWGYWALESLVGYQRWNPDPIVHANVMYSAYLGVMIGMYQSLHDDRRHDAPGSLSLRRNARTTYEYDFGSLAGAIRSNMLADPRSPQYPCEPHLVYPICNTFAINTLQVFDRLHGTQLTGDLVARVRESYDRDGWRRPDGHFLSGRSTGRGRIVFPGAVANDAFMAYWLSASMPDVGEQTYARIRERELVREGSRVALAPSRHGWVDPGNYDRAHGETFTQALTALAAREYGDEDTARALIATLEEGCEFERSDGARRIRHVSPFTNGIHVLLGFSRTGSLRELLLGRTHRAKHGGPILAEAAYPEVLVARAVSDGRALELVLRPGAGACTTVIAIEGLAPDATHRVVGARTERAVADRRGRLLLEVELRGRTEVRVAPVE